MAVRFFVRDGSSRQLTVTRPQADALLAAIGDEAAGEPAGFGRPPRPLAGELAVGPLLARLGALRRQLTRGRVREFTSAALNCDGLVQCVAAVQTLAEQADLHHLAVIFQETES